MQHINRQNISQIFSNHNVKLGFLYAFVHSIGRGIWMGNILSTFIYFVSNSNSFLLGLTSAASGIMMTAVVFPAGVIADKYRRDLVLKIASVVGIIALVILSLVSTLNGIFVALVFWGLFQGLTRPSLEAIFADSIESGSRSQIYSWRHLVTQFASATGPVLNIFLFLILGDEWNLTTLKTVMIVGLGITVLSLIIMQFFRDSAALGSQSEAVAKPVDARQNEENYKKNHSAQSSTIDVDKSQKKRLSLKHVPFILVGCNIIIGIGAGMTIKFFPIFFIEQYAMSPILVQIVMALTAIFTGISGILAQRFSAKRGRPLMIFTVQFFAIVCLAIITFYPPLWLLIPVFILRGALMNSAEPMSRSILMDIIPKSKRGKWNSLESLAWGLFWNFSATIGGWLIGSANNFQLNFGVTTIIYVLGTLPILLLIPLVSRE